MIRKDISEEINHNGHNKSQNTTNTKKEANDKVEVKIDISDDKESKYDTEDGKKDIRSDNVGKADGNTIVVMAFSGERPGGLLIGNTPNAQRSTLGDSPPPQYPANQEGLPPSYASKYPPPYGNDENSMQFYTPETRNRFIRLIMSLVFIMLLFTAAFIAVVLIVPSIHIFFLQNSLIILIPTMILIMIINYAMTCGSQCSKEPPCSFILLFLSVIGMSMLASIVTSYYSTHIILYAFVATMAVVLVCIVLACSNFDFTSYMLYVIVIVTAFSVIAMITITALIITKTWFKPAFLVLLVIGTLIQVLILTINLQLIIGGKTVELSDRDYVLGAYMVYMSIVDIFLKMVYIFGISSDM